MKAPFRRSAKEPALATPPTSLERIPLKEQWGEEFLEGSLGTGSLHNGSDGGEITEDSMPPPPPPPPERFEPQEGSHEHSGLVPLPLRVGSASGSVT